MQVALLTHFLKSKLISSMFLRYLLCIKYKCWVKYKMFISKKLKYDLINYFSHFVNHL